MDNLKKGMSCTVKHHYGHTDVNRVMIIEDIRQHANYKSGYCVKVSGLEVAVDAGLIMPIDSVNDTWVPQIYDKKLKEIQSIDQLTEWANLHRGYCMDGQVDDIVERALKLGAEWQNMQLAKRIAELTETLERVRYKSIRVDVEGNRQIREMITEVLMKK